MAETPDQRRARLATQLASARATRAAKATAALPPDTGDGPLLSEDDRVVIHEQAVKEVRERRRSDAIKAALDAEIAKLMRETGGPVVDGPMGEMVTMTIDLPENSNEIIWNGERLANGRSITAPRHVIAGYLDIMWRGQVAQHNLDGKTRDEFYRRQRPVVVSKGGAYQESESVRVG